jgi:GAF domain-containing protein
MTPHTDEQTRQRALDTYHIVDSLPDNAYDDIARLASILCDAPIALVSLVDRERQWWKARFGVEGTGSPREHAVCDHAIRTPGELFEVPDLSLDRRFADNPFVTGATQAMFYAGMPLVTPGGAAVGTVCVLDRAPRQLSPQQREALASLARLTMNLMESTRREREQEIVAAISPPPPSIEADVAVCLIELQHHAALVEFHGDRAVERMLNELDALIGAGLGEGDSINRVTHHAELVVALHGAGIDGALQRIERVVEQFGAQHELVLLMGHARSQSPTESPTSVYMRADAALSEAKDRASVGDA